MDWRSGVLDVVDVTGVIADLTKLQVTVSVPERDIASLKVGQSASVTFPAVDKAAATAKITIPPLSLIVLKPVLKLRRSKP